MNILTSSKENFVWGEIRKPGAKTVSAYITCPYAEKNTAKTVSLGLLYCDLLLSGSGTLSRDEFQFKLNELGSTISLSLENGKLTISISALEEKLKPTLVLLDLMLKKPAFKSKEYRRATKSLKNSLEQSKEDARSIALFTFKNSFFTQDSQHYSFMPEELIKAVSEVKSFELHNLHKSIIDSYWSVTVGGRNKSVDEFLKFIKNIKSSSTTPSLTEETIFVGYKGRQVSTHEIKTKQNIEFSIGGYLPLTLNDSSLPAFYFGLSVLAKWGGFSGRLMSTVREKEGLTYSIYGRAEGISVKEVGYWRIVTFFSPKDAIKGVTSTIREIENIHKNGITQSEWERFRTILKTGETLIFDSLSKTTGLVHSKLISGQSWEEYLKFREALYACTRTEINKVLKEYLDPQALTISAAGPVETVKKDLEKFTKSK